IMLIGFLPSFLAQFIKGKGKSYLLVTNALLIVSVVYIIMEEWALAGIFILVPVFSLLFQDRSIYLFASIASFILNISLTLLLLLGDTYTSEELVILLDVLTVFLITVFIIYFVVKDIRWRNM